MLLFGHLKIMIFCPISRASTEEGMDVLASSVHHQKVGGEFRIPALLLNLVPILLTLFSLCRRAAMTANWLHCDVQTWL